MLNIYGYGRREEKDMAKVNGAGEIHNLLHGRRSLQKLRLRLTHAKLKCQRVTYLWWNCKGRVEAEKSIIVDFLVGMVA